MSAARRSLPDPTTALLRRRIRTLFGHVPKALSGDEESIHQMRVAGRRLRVALPLLAQKPQGRRVRRALGALRELTRTAGVSRDLDVITALFDQRLAALGPLTRERGILRRRLRAVRTRSRRWMADALLDIEIARLRRDLRRIVARRGEPLFTALLRLRQFRDERGQLVLAQLAELGERFEPEALHRLRIRSRRLRYAAELAAELRGQESEAPALLRELQERLGHVHDAHMLAVWLEGQAQRAEARSDSPLAEEARALSAWAEQDARAHHAALLAAAPATVVQRALAAMAGAPAA